MNPDRKSMPDIDTDFDDEGRHKVINYVVGKYGKNQVAQIVTYGTMAAKMSIKDVAAGAGPAPSPKVTPSRSWCRIGRGSSSNGCCTHP